MDLNHETGNETAQPDLQSQPPRISLKERKTIIKNREAKDRMRREGPPLVSRPRRSIGLRGRMIAGAAAVGMILGFLSAPKPPGQAAQSNPGETSGPNTTPGQVEPNPTLSPEQALIQSNMEIVNYMNAYPNIRFTVSEGPIAIDFSKAIIETGNPNSTDKKDRVDNRFITEINGQKINLNEIYSAKLLFTMQDKTNQEGALWGLVVLGSSPNSQDPNPNASGHIARVHLTPANFPDGLNEHNFNKKNHDFKVQGLPSVTIGDIGEFTPVIPVAHPAPGNMTIAS